MTIIVSIIIPAYNAEATLGETLQSVAAQSFDAWECLIVDDKSTDDTADLANQWCKRDPRFRLIKAPKNFGGPAGPRNLGIEAAQGAYLAFLDSDDIWHRDKLRLQLASMKEACAEFSATGRRNFTKKPNLDDVNTHMPQKWIGIDKMLRKNRIATSSVMVSRGLMDDFRFNEARDFHAVEDFDCWLRILTHGHQCLRLEAPLLAYRHVAGQISGNKIAMARKFSHVLNNYRDHKGRSLGAKKMVYFCTYVWLSIWERVIWRLTD